MESTREGDPESRSFRQEELTAALITRPSSIAIMAWKSH
jgi:hypothetical protein